MKVSDLRLRLRELNVPDSSYSIGAERNESYCLVLEAGTWRGFYSERGTRLHERTFAEEVDSTQDLMDRLVRDNIVRQAMERRIRALFDLVLRVDGLPDEDCTHVEVLLEHNEPGEALETLLTQVYEWQLPLTLAVHNNLLALVTGLGVGHSLLSRIRDELVVQLEAPPLP